MQNKPDNNDLEVYHHQADNLPAHGSHDEEVLSEDRVKAYWRANVRLLLILLAVWFTVSYGFGILLVDWLNRFSMFGFKLGFWWAQQGSIYVFVILIFVTWRSSAGSTAVSAWTIPIPPGTDLKSVPRNISTASRRG